MLQGSKVTAPTQGGQSPRFRVTGALHGLLHQPSIVEVLVACPAADSWIDFHPYFDEKN